MLSRSVTYVCSLSWQCWESLSVNDVQPSAKSGLPVSPPDRRRPEGVRSHFQVLAPTVVAVGGWRMSEVDGPRSPWAHARGCSRSKDQDPARIRHPVDCREVRHNRSGSQSVSRAVWPETREGVVRMDWRHRALCRDEDPELFFPIGTTGPAERQVEEAKAVCRRCAVTSDCLSWALDTGQDSGVWGGLSEDERRALKRARMRVRTA